MISQEKWDKAKKLLMGSEESIKRNALELDRKRLEQIRGFLNYVCQTYWNLTPYLIGIHMSIDSWRSGRDEEGWRTNSMSETMIKLDKEWSDHNHMLKDHPKCALFRV